MRNREESKGPILDDSFFTEKLGLPETYAVKRKELVLSMYRRFRELFGDKVERGRTFVVSVPNRIEILGKHTDYQGGKTLVISGLKAFTAVASLSKDNLSELVNMEPVYGKTTVLHDNFNTDILEKGFGWQYSLSVFKRLLKNLREAGFPPVSAIKAVFYGDIPIGGGTSGSSAKVISDFITVALANNLLENKSFKELIIENGRLAGIKYDQPDIDNYRLALSMYIANYENGLDFGALKGDRGVGTFGGSEDHTAIMLGEKNKVLFCRYCPTEVLKKVLWPKNYAIVVGYSGQKAEKTANAMEKYNRLSINAKKSVEVLNSILNANKTMLRDFFKDLQPKQKAEYAYEILNEHGYPELAERAYQFYREEEIIEEAVDALMDNKMDIFGDLINMSHYLSRDYLKNITEEIDYLQKSALKIGALGSSGFGAGFGGSCYAIVPAEEAETFKDKWKNRYIEKFHKYKDVASFEIYKPCNGAVWEALHD